MFTLDKTVSRLPIVLVVDPVAVSRFAMWRLLSGSFGVLEASDARSARDWLTCRRGIDALVVQSELPDADGREFVLSLSMARVPVASRAIVVARPVDVRQVVTTLAGWLFSRSLGQAQALLRVADQSVS